MNRLLHVGDIVAYEGREYQVAALGGTWVRLTSSGAAPMAVLLTDLVGSDGFAIVASERSTSASTARVPRSRLEDVPAASAAAALDWERHVVEVETGLPPGAPPGSTPRPEYDPAVHPVRDRDAAKAAELSAAGNPTSAITVQRMRLRYRAEGVRGLVDRRSIKPVHAHGRTDPRLVEVVAEAVNAETSQSTGTRDRLRRRVEAMVSERYGDQVRMPSKSTFNRLIAVICEGRHTFGTATTRRSLANRPERPFTVTWAARPGQQVQIDTTPLDVLALFDDGHARRVELTAAVDVATRTICAAILRPAGTKAVDASMLLARMLVPEPMRPGWADVLRMSASVLPHRQLADIDARIAEAAAKPVVVPETIVCDRGRVYISQTFERACESLGISLQPAHPYAGTDKGVVEATFGSINTLFCQYVAGYTGRDATHRGTAAQVEACWSMPQLQDLLDEWIIAGWQQRPHGGLRSPDTGRALSPNEMYAVLVSAAGYVPLMLTGDDYIELLDTDWRNINDYGVRLDKRTYDSRELNPYRRQDSGIVERKGRWEVRYDPYDLRQIWVRDHHVGGWIRAVWTHLPMASAPFADFTWRHARQLAGPGANEAAIARVLDELLRRAEKGPQPVVSPSLDQDDQRVASRTRSAASSHRPPLQPVELPADPDDDFDDESGVDDQEVGTVIPFGIFDARAEARRWP